MDEAKRGKNKLTSRIPLLLLIAGLLWLRLINLGYSDYQGDEIKALFLPVQGQSFVDFLLSQRKGPTQFIVTYLIGFLDPTYLNQFLVRLPFAIASVLGAIFFFYFVKIHFDRKIAIYATFFFSYNGIIVALSRITQYQSFVILFYTLALYLLTLAVRKKEWRIFGLYLGMICWGLSMLSHFDGIFIAPFMLYLLWQWSKLYPGRNNWMHIILSAGIIGFVLAAFYIPLFMGASDDTLAYWLNRLSGGENLISSSVVTFNLYNPKFVFYLYSGLFFIYLAGAVVVFLSRSEKEAPFALSNPLWKRSLYVLLWFLFPFLYMETVVNVPGTHIYTYLTPLAILISIGFSLVERLLKQVIGFKYGRILSGAAIALIFLFLFYQSHKLFVDHTREYPWESERFLFWTLQEPDRTFHLPIFGFPYYRQWQQIGEIVSRQDGVNSYYTNEKDTISRFYIPYPFDATTSGPYILVRNVQYIYQGGLDPKAQWWPDHHRPELTFSSCDYGDFAWGLDLFYVFAPVHGDCANQRIVAEVYFMTPGSLEEILAQRQ